MAVGPLSTVVEEYFSHMKGFSGWDRYDGLSTTLSRVMQSGRMDLIRLGLDMTSNSDIKQGRMLNGLRSISLDLEIKDLKDAISYMTICANATGLEDGVFCVPDNFSMFHEGLSLEDSRKRDAYVNEPHKYYPGTIADITRALNRSGRFTHVYFERFGQREFGENTLVLLNHRPEKDTTLDHENRFRYNLIHIFAGKADEIKAYAKKCDKIF